MWSNSLYRSTKQRKPALDAGFFRSTILLSPPDSPRRSSSRSSSAIHIENVFVIIWTPGRHWPHRQPPTPQIKMYRPRVGHTNNQYQAMYEVQPHEYIHSTTMQTTTVHSAHHCPLTMGVHEHSSARVQDTFAHVPTKYK